MPEIEDRLAKIKAIQAEAEAKKVVEKEAKAKESAEKRTGLEQEKTQVEGELAQTTEELQKNESGLAEINAMDLSALDAESRAAIESEIVGIKEEMDNLSGKVVELTKRKQEIDEELKGETKQVIDDESQKSETVGDDAQSEKAEEESLPKSLQQELARDLNNEESQKLQEFQKRLDELKSSPNKELIKRLRGNMIVDLSERVKEFANTAREALKDMPKTGAQIELMNKVLDGKFLTQYGKKADQIFKEVIALYKTQS